MAWKVHALGSGNQKVTMDAAAVIINQELGPCTVGTSSSATATMTYTFNGVDYSFKCCVLTSKSFSNVLLTNDETGEFIVANFNTSTLSSTYDQIYAAILRIQTDRDTVQLLPLHNPGNSFTDVFAVAKCTGDNSGEMSIRPAFTGPGYKTEGNYRPIVDVYEYLGTHLQPGTYVQVDGQTFLCAAQRLLVKL